MLYSPVVVSSHSDPKVYLSGARGLPSGPAGRLDGTSKKRETEVLLPNTEEFRSESITDPEIHVVLPIGTHSVPRLKIGEALPCILTSSVVWLGPTQVEPL